MTFPNRFRHPSAVVLTLALAFVPFQAHAQGVSAAGREHQSALAQAAQARVAALEAWKQSREAAAQLRAREVQERIAEAEARAKEMSARAAELQTRARQVVVRLRSRVRLGVSLDGQQGEEYDRQGARVEGVLEDSPAEKAGLKEGDIITHLNGRSLLDPLPEEEEEDLDPDQSLPVQRLMALASKLEPGEEVEVRYLREGQARSVVLEAADLGEREELEILGEPFGRLRGRILEIEPGDRFRWTLRLPEEEDLRFEGPRVRVFPFGEEGRSVYRLFGPWSSYGLDLAELNLGLAEYFQTDHGVLVLDVDEDSDLGLHPGDVIQAIDGRRVEDPEDVRRILGSYERDEEMTLTVVRHGAEIQVQGTRG